MMKKLYFVFAILIIAAMSLSACAPAVAPAEPQAPTETTVVDEAPVAEEVAQTEEEAPTEEVAAISETEDKFAWDQDYISEVPPIMMIDPYLQIFGQSQVAVPYTYETAVKLAGHSCGAVTGAWTITRKALEVLYPGGEVPVRGQIQVEAPGAEDEWYVGVFGEVITYITGAAPKTGFIGAEFGQTDDVFVRQNNGQTV